MTKLRDPSFTFSNNRYWNHWTNLAKHDYRLRNHFDIQIFEFHCEKSLVVCQSCNTSRWMTKCEKQVFVYLYVFPSILPAIDTKWKDEQNPINQVGNSGLKKVRTGGKELDMREQTDVTKNTYISTLSYACICICVCNVCEKPTDLFFSTTLEC